MGLSKTTTFLKSFAVLRVSFKIRFPLCNSFSPILAESMKRSKLPRISTRQVNSLAFVLLLTGWLNVGISTGVAHADIIEFKLTGAAGEGLLEGNIDPGTGETGTGGIGSTGITFNTNTNILHIDVLWGSANGFTDLSADVMMLHLHGPTPDSGTDAFGQTAPLMITLSNSASFDASASSGSVNDNFFVDNDDVSAVLEGRTYINVHLSDSDTGVIRGYLLAVPEPSSMLVLPVVMLALFVFRRTRRLSPVVARSR